MRRLLTPSRRVALGVLVIVAAALPPGIAYGASLTGTNRQVGGGFSAVAGCGTMANATVGWTVRGGNAVMAAEVTGLPTACNGAIAAITLANSSNTDIGSRSGVTVSGGSAVFATLTANPDPANVVNVHFSVNGP